MGEQKTGETYSGKLLNAEDSMNCHLTDVTCRSRTGQPSALDSIYLRGSHIRLVILPSLLQHGPYFTSITHMLKKRVEEEQRKSSKTKRKWRERKRGGREID